MFGGFFSDSKLSKSITSSFLTLVQKIKNPLDLDDCLPICLVGWIHKIISKLLAGRLKKVIGKVISLSQSVFVPKRQLLDGVLVVNELVNNEFLLFKVDFEKAYDKVSWAFIRFMLRKMGFGAKWKSLMEALIFTSNMSVLVIRSLTKEFKVERGLR